MEAHAVRPAHRRLRLKDCKLNSSLNYIAVVVHFFNYEVCVVGHSLAILVTGRTKELTLPFKKYFITMAKDLGFTEDMISYPTPIGNGQLGKEEGVWTLFRPDAARPGKEEKVALLPHS